MRWGRICAASVAVFVVSVAILAILYVSNEPSSKPLVDLAFLALAGMIVSATGWAAGRRRGAGPGPQARR